METEFETEIDEPEVIPSSHISAHLGIWCMIDSIEAELSGVTPTFKSDAAFCDCYGITSEGFRLLKLKIKNRLLHEAQIKQSD